MANVLVASGDSIRAYWRQDAGGTAFFSQPVGPPPTDPATPSAWPLEDRWARYHRAEASSSGSGGTVQYHRSDFVVPPFDLDSVPSGGTADEGPRMVYDAGGRLRLLFARKSGGTWDVYESVSDDGGATFGILALRFPGCRRATIARGAGDQGAAVMLRAAIPSGGGAPRAMLQHPGDDAPRAAYTLRNNLGGALSFSEDGFHAAQEPLPPMRWFLVARVGSSIILYSSVDAVGWDTVLAGVFGSAVSPTLAFGRDGTMFLACRTSSGTTLRGRVWYPGEAAPRAEFTFKDDTGTNLSTLNGGGFGIAPAPEEPRRWLLAAPVQDGSDRVAADWFSTDGGATWKRIA